MGRVDTLIQRLERAEFRWDRRLAAIELGQFGDPKAVPALLKALDDTTDGHGTFRIPAVNSIGQIADLNAIPELLDAYDRHFSVLGEPIIKAIGEILGRATPNDDKSRKVFSDTVDWLLQMLQKGNWEMFTERDAAAAEALGKARDPKAIPVLAKHLIEDHRPEVATAAARAFRYFSDPQAIQALIQAATNKSISADVRAAAVKSLGDIGKPELVDTLIQIMEEPSKESSPRAEAARALGRIGDPKAIEPLIRTLDNEWHTEAVAKAIAEALGNFRNPRVTDTLVRIIAHNSGAAPVAAESLVKLRDKRAVEPLIRVVEDARYPEDRRGLAADVLAALGDPRAIPALVDALYEHHFAQLHERAIAALQRFALTNPDAMLRIDPEDRNILGRLIQDAENDEFLRELCSKSRRKTR
jgi:HEAT repeat protein